MGKEGVTVTFCNDGCAVLTMRHGENRVNPNFIEQLNTALDEVERNKSCRLLVTTGTGKYYSNGFDINWFRKQNLSDVEPFLVSMTDCFWRLIHFPVPTVAAINGHAFGAGAFLALSHDYRVMRSDRGWITWNEVLHNFPIREISSRLIRLKLSSEAVRESVVFAKRLNATEAKVLGITDDIAENEQLITKSISTGKTALGQNDLTRESLQRIKMAMFPKSIVQSKI